MSDQSDPKTPGATHTDQKSNRESSLDLSSAMALMAENSDMLDDSDFSALAMKPPPKDNPLNTQEILSLEEPGIFNDWEVPANSSPALSASSPEETENLPRFSLSSIDPDDLPAEDMMTGSVYDPELQQMLASGNFAVPEKKPEPDELGLAAPLIAWDEDPPEEKEEDDEFSLDAVEKALGGSEEPLSMPDFLSPAAPEPEVPAAPLQALEDFQPPPLLLNLREVSLPSAQPVSSPSTPPPFEEPPLMVAPAPTEPPAPEPFALQAPQPFPQAPESFLPPPPMQPPAPERPPIEEARPAAPRVARPFIPPALPDIDPLEAMLASIENRSLRSSSIPLPMSSADDAASMFDDVQGTQVLTMDEIVEVIPMEQEAPQKAPQKAPQLPPRLPPPRPPVVAKSSSPFSPWVKGLPALETIADEQSRAWLSIYSAEASAKESERGSILYEAGEFYELTLGDVTSALACYRESLALLPSFEPARFGVLRLLAREQNHEEFEAQLHQSEQATTGPQRAWIEVERGFFLESKRKDTAGASAAYYGATLTDPEQLVALLALSRLPQTDATATDELTSKLINTTQEPKWKAAWQLLGAHHRGSKLGDIKGAESALREALRFDPAIEGAASALQRNLARQEKFTDLLLALNQEAESAPSVEAAALLRNTAALSWYQQGDADAAWISVEQALAHTPSDAALLPLAVQLAQARNNPEQAEELSKQLALTTTGRDQQPLAFELSLAKLRGKETTLDDASRQLFQGLAQGDFAEETLRIVGRLFRRSLQRSSETDLLLERRAHAESDEAASIDLWLGLLASDPSQARLHFTSALSNAKEARYAALFLADLHKDAGEAASEYEALHAALLHTTSAEEASVFGLRAAYLARFILQDAAKYAETLSLLGRHQIISKRELSLALENAARPQEAAALLREALSEAPALSDEATRGLAKRLAILQESLLQQEEALGLYTQIEAANPGDLFAILGLERCGAPAALRAAAYERAAQREEAKLPLLHRAAALYLESGRFADAARLYRGLTSESEGGALAAFGLLASCRALRDEATLQEALSLLATRADELGVLAAIERAAYSETHQQTKEAAALYEKALQSPYPIAELARELALSLAAREGEWPKVEALSAPILSSAEPSLQARRRALRVTLASAYEITSAEKARAYYQEILNESPNDMIALRGALRCSLAMNDKASAARCAIKLADNSDSTTALTDRLLAIRLLDESKQPGIPEQLTAALSQGKTHPAVLYTIESHRGKGALRNDLRLAYEARLNQVTQEERTIYMLRLGELEAEAGRAAQGLPILEVAKDRAPTDIATLLSARRVARLAENRTSFLRLSEALVSQLHEPKQIAAVLREAAMVEEAAGNLDSAETLVRRALEKHPGEKNLIAVQARLLALRGNDAALHALLEKNVEVLEEPTLALSLGLAQKRLGKREEARRSLLRALSSTPGNVSILESLHALDRELGRHDEASELARRLLKRAHTDQEKAVAEKRLADSCALSSRREDAIAPYLNYLKLRPEDEQATEQFLAFVREINRPRDGIALLEGRYQSADKKQERRKLAERLGRYLDLELSQPTNAADWYGKALSEDPLGAECGTRLVYLWRGKEEKRLSALLEGTLLQLVESIKADPGRWEVYRKLAEVFGWRGNRARYRAIVDLAKMVRLEDELPPSSVLLSPLTPPSRVITAEELKQLIPQPRPVRDLLVTISELLPKVFPRSASDLDLGRRDRLRDGPGGERRKEIELLASRFNIKIYDAFMGGDPNRCMILQSGADFTAILGANLVARPLSQETYFELGRSFTMAHVGLLPILDADAAGLEGIIRGMAWCADEKLRERDRSLPPNMARIAKAIYDAMTRRLKQSHMDQFAALAQSFPKNLGALAQDLVNEADRGGLITAGSLLSALRCVSPPRVDAARPANPEQPTTARGEEALRELLAKPRVISLLQYALTKEYEDLALALSAI